MSHRAFSGISKNTIIIAIGSFFADLSTEMLTPVLPIFLTQTFNATGSIVGLVDGVAQAIRNLANGFSGPISDTLKQRKVVALLGFALGVVAKPLMGWSSVWQGVLAGRMLDRLGAGVRSAPRDALVASSVDDRHQGHGFGLEGFGENAGAFCGPLVAVLIIYAAQLEMRTIFYLAFIPGLLALIFVSFAKERMETNDQRKSSHVLNFRAFPATYWTYIAATAVFSIGNSSNAFLILRTQEAGGSFLITALTYAGFNLVAAILSYPTASASDSWGKKPVLLGSYVVFFIVYMCLSFTGSLVAVILLFLIYGVHQGSFRAVGRAFASDLAPHELRATGLGWFGATVGLCQLVASVIAGMLWDTFGHSSAFMYGAAFSAAGIVVMALIAPAGNTTDESLSLARGERPAN